MACTLLFRLQGQESTIDEDDDPNPAPPTSPMERFRLAWDSEARADWPVAEPLALMSEQAYLDPVDAEPAYRKLGFRSFHRNRQRDHDRLSRFWTKM